MVKWLTVGGFLFLRESSSHQPGDSQGKNNPPRDFIQGLDFHLTKCSPFL